MSLTDAVHSREIVHGDLSGVRQFGLNLAPLIVGRLVEYLDHQHGTGVAL